MRTLRLSTRWSSRYLRERRFLLASLGCRSPRPSHHRLFLSLSQGAISELMTNIGAQGIKMNLVCPRFVVRRFLAPVPPPPLF